MDFRKADFNKLREIASRYHRKNILVTIRSCSNLEVLEKEIKTNIVSKRNERNEVKNSRTPDNYLSGVLENWGSTRQMEKSKCILHLFKGKKEFQK